MTYSPETLALRWGCSPATIRNRCAAGDIQHFRLGKLYRITEKTVEDIECQTSLSADCEAASASSGATAESDTVISLRHAPERKQRRKG
ncbi:helix-turn-helix domain-containing protein [Seohaeicola nanhaiensis]|uniref:Helix-turn-helix domain-containing protein n=1 Tax=Seohaeicola nanhaiensis TaxID=1387282 RepID=A0ABV9KDN0_9RHOB